MTCVILLNGDYEDDAYYLRQVDAAQAVVAADGGHAFLRRHGRWPALLIGDFDSLDAGLLAEAEAAGVEVVRHPARKDETDAELAVAQAEARFAGEIVLLGALGGALDHVLGHLSILQGLAARGRAARIAAPGSPPRSLRGPAHLRFGAPSAPRSPSSRSRPDVVLSLRGLEYELTGERLSPTVCRGLGNSLVAADARLDLSSGALLVLVFDGRETFAAAGRRRIR